MIFRLRADKKKPRFSGLFIVFQSVMQPNRFSETLYIKNPESQVAELTAFSKTASLICIKKKYFAASLP
jgi:hypothetical protein